MLTMLSFAARRGVPLLMLCVLLISSLPGHTPTVARAEQGSRIHLPLLTRQTSFVPPEDVTSEELIDRAVREGRIDAETALRFKVFALFGDPRLPTEYRGARPPLGEGDVLDDVVADWTTLAPATQAELEPFLIPPAYDHSWANLAPGRASQTPDSPSETGLCGAASADWTWIDSLNGKARFWWKFKEQSHGQVARLLMREWDNVIFQKLTTLMGREHLSDVDEACNGLGDRLDIYVADFPTSGFAFAYKDKDGKQCGPRPTFIEISPGLPEQNLRSTLAHEYMHALQWAFKVKPKCFREEYKWWMEATGSWAMHYVYPDDNAVAEHALVRYFQDRPAEPIETDLQYRHYGAYLLPFMLARRHGDDIVRRSWEAMAELDPHTALNGVMPGGWEEQWPEFVKHNWNRPPVDDYLTWDSMGVGARPEIDQALSLAGQPYAQHALTPSDVPRLAARYYRFEFADQAARSVMFENPYAHGTFPTARVQAIYRLADGSRAVDDWTNKPWRSFCRERLDERIMELVIVVSNHEWRDASHVLSPARPPRLHLSNVACRGWKVEADVVQTSRGPSVEWNMAITANATLVPYRDPSVEGLHVGYYRIADGRAEWNYGGSMSICSGSGNGTYSVVDPAVPFSMIVESFGVPFLAPGSPGAVFGTRMYNAIGKYPGHLPDQFITVRCPNSSFEQRVPLDIWWLTSADNLMRHSIDANGTRASGSTTMRQSSGGDTTVITFTWKMTALPPE